MAVAAHGSLSADERSKCRRRFLERELNLQIDAAVRAGGRKGPSSQGIRLTKERRADNAAGRGEVHHVQNVARRDAERQIVTAIGAASHSAKRAAAAVFTATSMSAAWSSARTTSRGRSFRLSTESERLAEPHVQGETR